MIFRPFISSHKMFSQFRSLGFVPISEIVGLLVSFSSRFRIDFQFDFLILDKIFIASLSIIIKLDSVVIWSFV